LQPLTARFVEKHDVVARELQTDPTIGFGGPFGRWL
jgi:hypothetical protein